MPATSVETDSVNELSLLEEKVIRMKHGLSEDGDHVLAFAVGASHETRLELAFLERQLLAKVYNIDIEDK